MPKQEVHLNQARSNLVFLQSINQNVDGFFDWKVTVCFYTAVHLINSHLAKFQLQYRSHLDVNHALNPVVQMSPSKLPEDEYISYISLQSLSRRSRYLVNEKDNKLETDNVYSTYEKHFAKALRHLDRLLTYFEKKYNYSIPPINIKCSLITQNDKLKFFVA